MCMKVLPRKNSYLKGKSLFKGLCTNGILYYVSCFILKAGDEAMEAEPEVSF